MTPFKLAKLSLARHRLSTIISVCSIGLGIAICGILLRLYQVSDARFSLLGNGGDAIVAAKAGGIEIVLNALNAEGRYPEFLPYALFKSLKTKQAVRHGDQTRTYPSYILSITPFVYFGKFKNYRAVGTDESFFYRYNPKENLNFSSGDWSDYHNNVVLGSTIAQSMNLKVDDTIEIQTWIGDDAINSKVSFKVSGILASTQSTWDRTIFSSVKSAHNIFESKLSKVSERSIWGPNVLHYFLVNLKPNSFSSFESLINKRTVGQIVDIQEQQERLRELSGVGKSLGLFVTIFVLFLGGLSITSMLVTRFEGMSLQLAVLRAIGYTKIEISKSLAWEGFLLGTLGVVVGALIDLTAFPIIRILLGDALPPSEMVDSSIFQSSVIWIIAIIATISSVFVPMAKIAKQDAHALLRGM